MEIKTFTTGEVAKLCKVSIRTVQYYDKENIVKPTKLSEGGRRIYSEADLAKFQLACLFKNLGFSLDEIKTILESGDEYKTILELLNIQEEKMEEQIKQITLLKKKLSVFQEELSANQMITILNDDEMNLLLAKKEKLHKSDRMTYFLLVSLVVITTVGLLLTGRAGGAYLPIMIGIVTFLLLGLIYYHSSQYAYICPYCKKKFTIGFFKDMLSLNGAKKGKYLRCPDCHRRSWMAETYKDN